MSQQGAKDTKAITTKKGGQTGGSGNQTVAHKVKEVRNITGWPDDDIKRVLEKYNYDTEISIDAIVEGIPELCSNPFYILPYSAFSTGQHSGSVVVCDVRS